MFVWARGVSVPLGSWTQVKHTALSISTIWQRLKRKQSGSGQEYSFLAGILFLFISNGPSGLQHQTAHYLASFAHIEPILSDLSQILHTAQSSYRRQVRPEIYKNDRDVGIKFTKFPTERRNDNRPATYIYAVHIGFIANNLALRLSSPHYRQLSL